MPGKTIPAPPDALVELLGRHFFLGRSTTHLPLRHGIIHGRLYRERIAALPARPGPEDLALRGRIRRLLGDLTLAKADLDAAVAAAPASARARAWRWELATAAGGDGGDDLEKAVKLEPRNGWWRLWTALERLSAGGREAALERARAAAELLPREGLPRAVEAMALSQLKRLPEAIAALDAALELEPGTEWALRLRAICKKESGDDAGCLADCVRAMSLDENSGLLFVMLGLHRLKTDTARSVAAATKHIEARPDDFWAYVFRADNRRSPDTGDNLGAIEDLRRASSLAPQYGWVWAYLSRCQLTLGDFKGSSESMAKAVELEPECGWIQAWRGESLRRSGDARGALRALDRAIELFPDYELAYAWRGSSRRLLGKPEEALEDLNIAIALRPHTLDLCYFERMQTYRALGRTGEALEDLMKASRLNPKYVWEAEPKRFAAGLAELDARLKRAPKDALAHLWRGDVMMRRRDFVRAEKDLGRAIALKDAPAEAYVLRGRTRCELKKWKAALADLDEAVARDPESAFAYAWRGRAKVLTDRHEEAVADFDRALELETNSAWILSWKGEAEFRLKRWSAAEESLSKAIQVHVRFAEAWLWRGAARAQRGDAEGALKDLDRALELQPGEPRALYYRAGLLLKTGRTDEARADAAAALAAPGPLSAAEIKTLKAARAPGRAPRAAAAPAGLVEKALALQKEGRHAESAEIFTGLLAKKKGDADLLRLRAEAYRCLGRYDLALRDHDEIVKASPRDADALTNRVELKRHLRDFQGGLRDADAAIKLDSKSPSARVLRAECLRSLGRYDEAIESASEAIRLDPAWPWAKIVRAKARRQKGDLEAALADTREAEKAGTDAYARGWRADILRKAGRLEESLAEMTLALSLQPHNAWFRALRGQIQCELGAPDKGLADLVEAMRQDPRASCEYDFLGAEGPEVRADASLAWVLALRGGVRRAQGELAAARADFDRAAAQAPACFWILAWRGELLVAQGESDEGLAQIRRALKLFPGYAQAWIWAGQALVAADKIKPALESFDAALKLEPDNVWGLIGRAVCLEKSGKSVAAAALFARAQALAPALFAAAKTT